MVKLIAFHLPQYHSFPENDEWWGKGFTDWNNVKKAKELYKGHKQPRIPLDGYYNMLDKQTHMRQMELAKEYGIYAFCYYHYWFNGKLLLEKPLEMILNEKDIDMPFCMCWANEPWTKSWDGKSKEVIMPQSYGDRNDWKKHIDYLLPFFLDDRYIKIDNRPIFVIYRTNNIPNCDEIISLWDEECKRAGFKGVFIIEENNNFQNGMHCKNSSAILDFEPNYTRSLEKTFISKLKLKINNILGTKYSKWPYCKTCENMILRTNDETTTKPHYLGIFTGWDNTPRRAKGGSISEGATPQNFEKYLQIQVKRSDSQNQEFLFINAWNEWAEGAYLEPDKLNGFKMLEAVKKVVKNQ